MNIRVDLNTPIYDGMEVVFKAPCDYAEVSRLAVYYPTTYGTTSQVFAFADAHANDLAHLVVLFAKDAVVKVILDLSTSMAFVQNADTNAYLERRLAAITRDISAAKLSVDEKSKLSTLVGDEWLTSQLIEQSNNLHGFATWAYRNAGVDVSSYLDTVHGTFNKMFDATAKSQGGNNDYKLRPETADNRYQLAMLVPGSYGGGEKMTSHGYEYDLGLGDQRVGDIFCMRYSKVVDGESTSNCYYMALCTEPNEDVIEGGQYILYEDYGPTVNLPNRVRVCSFCTLESLIWDGVDPDGQEIAPIYYYQLRPENVANADALYAEHKVKETEDKMKNLSNAASTYTGQLPISKGGTGATSTEKALTNLGAMPGKLVHESITITPTSKSLDQYIDDYLAGMASGANKIVHAVNSKGNATQFSLRAGGNRWMLLITKITSNYARVLAWCTGTHWVRSKSDGVWGEWCIESPTMEYGTEYRTTEKHLGKPVYTKLINCGALPIREATMAPAGNYSKSVYHGAGNCKIIRSTGVCGGCPMPFTKRDGTPTMFMTVGDTSVTIYWDSEIYNNGPQCAAQIWYTK